MIAWVQSKAIAILVGALVLVAGVSFFWIRALHGEVSERDIRIGGLQKTVEREVEVNKNQTKQIEDLIRVNQVQAAAFQKRSEEFTQIARELSGTLLQGIENAPETDNGPVSPILRDTIERLRALRQAGSSRDNRDQSDPPVIPPRPPREIPSPRVPH